VLQENSIHNNITSHRIPAFYSTSYIGTITGTWFWLAVRKFTTISEKLEPEDLVHLLNEYLDEMTSIILNNQGLVDKYMGDAIMAFWGAPIDQPDHAAMACASSLEMLEKLKGDADINRDKKITVEELMTRVDWDVQRYVRENTVGQAQKPTLLGSKKLSGTVLLETDK